MTREQEEFQECDCTQCNKQNYIHRKMFRRLPVINGALDLRPDLKES